MGFVLEKVPMAVVKDLCRRHHVYQSSGSVAVYAFGVVEEGRVVAAFAWAPPPVGAARSVCPEAPHGVLALSRMVAVPKQERKLKHISKPLRRQMKKRIDRTRWPVLVTFSDEGAGHTGYVYACSGWEKTTRREVFAYSRDGIRVSRYQNGVTETRGLERHKTVIQRWEHWACPRGEAAAFMESHGWQAVERGGAWRSGAPRRKIVRRGHALLP